MEFPMQPLDELRGRGLWKRPCSSHSIHFCLNAYMRRCFDLPMTPAIVAIELPRERTLDVARPYVMPFDEVAVVGVHDAREVRQVGGRTGVQ